MRPELLDPVRDQTKLQLLLPLAEEVFHLHEAGQSYTKELKAISRLTNRIVGEYDVDAAFGCGKPGDFARTLLIDWHALPSDLSESEMLELIEAVCTAQGNQVYNDYWVKCLEVNTGDDQLGDLIFWPDEYFGDGYDGHELSPSEILEIALRKKAKTCGLTRRSTPLLSVAGRCAMKPRSAGDFKRWAPSCSAGQRYS